MKLDKIKFARLIGIVTNYAGHVLMADQVEELDRLIDFEVPEVATIEVYPKNENVERLMSHMAAGTSKIDAIREHRAITGMGLKESKEAVERYWKADKPNSYTYSELKAKLNQASYNADEEAAIMHFLTSISYDH